MTVRALTVKDLIAFTNEIAAEFNEAKIPHPVHLSDGNEAQLIEAFKGIKPDDWLCGTWRMHYQCLLKGVPREELRAEILAGHSMALCFPKHRIVSSAIVGGILPIALGIAMGVKRSGGAERVHCFLGDMTARTGIFHECSQYASWHDLPIRWIIEDNGVSVCTDTRSAWGVTKNAKPKRSGYAYKSKYPHAGAGKRVEF